MTGRGGGPFPYAPPRCIANLTQHYRAGALGETAKLRYATLAELSHVALQLNGILEISACVCIRGVQRVHVCTSCRPTLFGCVICEGTAEALLARA